MEYYSKFILANADKIVYLSVYLTEDMVSAFENGPDEQGRIVFTVSDNYDETIGTYGNEYLIHVPTNGEKGFEFDSITRKLSGYFKVWGINGPRQGFISVNLRPISNE